ncbi:response regulator transcription factor [Bacillus rubiinfantis]|uniref:response regulator transcription factor n=1 Tax=Bacillus rubiinfantis TaxID=1499680 RepID=UPI0006939B4D|nr:response regulator transcription factor [Bacillus rubiinfantis]
MTTEELCRILIVDDELLIRQGIRHYLDWEQEGFVIVGEAANGREALEMVELTNPHIIIMDIVMPIMDGEELTRIVKKRYPDIEVIILSSFGDFDYVRSTFQSGVVDYILKPKLNGENLLKAVKTAASKIPSLAYMNKNIEVNLSFNQILEKLITGYEVKLNEELLLKELPFDTFCLLGLDVNREQADGSPKIPLEEFKKVFTENVKDAVCFPLPTDEKVFLVNCRHRVMPDIRIFVGNFLKSHSNINGVLTEEFLELSQLGYVYKHSLADLVNCRFYFPDVQLLTASSIKPSREPKHFNLEWFTGELKRKHFDIAFHYLEEHVSVISTCYTIDIYDYKAFFNNIIFNITILLSNMGYDVKDLEQSKYSYFRAVDEVQFAGEAVVILNGFIDKVRAIVRTENNQSDNQNLKKIMDYIMEHYTEPLTLTDVANHFHFNPSYLSSFFSSHNKEGFNGFLNKVRIEEATKLLTKGKIPISEISSMVGYSDHSYFCKVFKKISGISPSQYRKQQIRVDDK